MIKEYRNNATNKALFVLGGVLVFVITFILMTNLMKTPVYGDTCSMTNHSHSVSVAETVSSGSGDTLKGGSNN